MSEGVVAGVLAQVPGPVHHGPGRGVVVSDVLDVVAVGHLVLVPGGAHGRLLVTEQVLAGVLVQGAEVAGVEVLGGGLVHGARPDGGGRGQGLVKLMAGHGGDGGAGLGAPAGHHEVPHHLGAVRRSGGLRAFLDDADDNEDQDEDDNDAEGDDQDQDGGGLCRGGGVGVRLRHGAPRPHPQVARLVVEAPGAIGHEADVQTRVRLLGVVDNELVEVTLARDGDVLPGMDHPVPVLPYIDREDVRGRVLVLLLEPLDVRRGGALDPALEAGRVSSLDRHVP